MLNRSTRWPALLAAVAALLATVTVHAAAPPAADPAQTAYATCMDKSDGTNPAWSVCGQALVDAEEVRLNATWTKAYADLETKSKADLLAEERAWIAYKDKSCLYLANGDYGREGQVVDYPNCRAGVIVERIKYLETLGD
jgi:uncharacterized protein YecT (DUF1311 family)